MTHLISALVLATIAIGFFPTRKNKPKILIFCQFILYAVAFGVASYTGYLLLGLITVLFGLGIRHTPNEKTRSTSLKIALMVTFVGPILEELAFRLPLIYIQQHHSEWIVSASVILIILFTVIHQYHGKYALVSLTLAHSALYTMSALYFGLASAIALHMINNASVLVKHLRGHNNTWDELCKGGKNFSARENKRMLSLCLILSLVSLVAFLIAGFNPKVFFVTYGILIFGLRLLAQLFVLLTPSRI